MVGLTRTSALLKQVRQLLRQCRSAFFFSSPVLCLSMCIYPPLSFQHYPTDPNPRINKLGINVVVVHGGGPQIAAMLKRLNVQSEFIEVRGVDGQNRAGNISARGTHTFLFKHDQSNPHIYYVYILFFFFFFLNKRNRGLRVTDAATLEVAEMVRASSSRLFL